MTTKVTHQVVELAALKTRETTLIHYGEMCESIALIVRQMMAFDQTSFPSIPWIFMILTYSRTHHHICVLDLFLI